MSCVCAPQRLVVPLSVRAAIRICCTSSHHNIDWGGVELFSADGVARSTVVCDLLSRLLQVNAVLLFWLCVSSRGWSVPGLHSLKVGIRLGLRWYAQLELHAKNNSLGSRHRSQRKSLSIMALISQVVLHGLWGVVAVSFLLLRLCTGSVVVWAKQQHRGSCVDGVVATTRSATAVTPPLCVSCWRSWQSV